MEENEKKKIIVKAKTNTTISEIAKKQIEESKYPVVGAIFNNEPMVLKDFFGDYELVWNPKQLSEQGAENEFAEVH